MAERICIICSSSIPEGSRAQTCSRRCLNRRAYERSKTNGMYEKMLARKRRQWDERRPAPVSEPAPLFCKHCGLMLGPGRRDRKFCSAKCMRDGQPVGCSVSDCERPLRAKGMCNKHYRQARGEKTEWNDSRRDAYHRRRARLAEAATGNPVRLAEIKVRDGGRCHICRRAVGSKPYPHPRSASLDHVVPLSKGGAHDPSNVRLACLSCNVEKGSGGGNEQLLLIG